MGNNNIVSTRGTFGTHDLSMVKLGSDLKNSPPPPPLQNEPKITGMAEQASFALVDVVLVDDLLGNFIETATVRKFYYRQI